MVLPARIASRFEVVEAELALEILDKGSNILDFREQSATLGGAGELPGSAGCVNSENALFGCLGSGSV